MAAMEMLRSAIRRCPDALWNAADGEKPFWQVAYHTIYYLDFHTSNSPSDFQPPPSHIPGIHSLAETPSAPLSREQVEGYLEETRSRCAALFRRMTLDDLSAPSNFPRRTVPTRVALLLYNLRHVQHHVGTMHSYLRRKTGNAPKWLAAG